MKILIVFCIYYSFCFVNARGWRGVGVHLHKQKTRQRKDFSHFEIMSDCFLLLSPDIQTPSSFVVHEANAQGANEMHIFRSEDVCRQDELRGVKSQWCQCIVWRAGSPFVRKVFLFFCRFFFFPPLPWNQFLHRMNVEDTVRLQIQEWGTLKKP